jgi:2-polyprenyl-6-hydroxyphenyl methylase/3-demethylubiquinone-9 3-methyltransferase
MKNADEISGYLYRDDKLNPSHAYLLPKLRKIIQADGQIGGAPATIFDVGCGNGSVANELTNDGFRVTGIDPSTEGIARAHLAFPHLRLEAGSAYDELSVTYGTYDVVLSLEVVCHLCFPRAFAKTVYNLTKPGGIAIISTPYHGYWKNLLLALTGKMSGHFRPLWDYGYVKFWSVNTLRELLVEAGFKSVEFHFAGRFWPLSSSMIAVARREA